MTASVSVALGTHNGAEYVADQLRSILNQTVPVNEIVVSDDASRDGTVEIIEGVMAAHADGKSRAPALIVFRNDPALGVTANFAQAIAACTGEFIALSDQDDLWRTDKVERALAAFAQTPSALLAFSDARMVDAAGADLGQRLFDTLGINTQDLERLRSEDAFEVLLKRNLVTGATTVFRRELAVVAAPFPASWVHDEWLAAVAAATGRLALIAEPLIDYRQHGGNQIGASSLTASSAVARLRTPRTARNRRLLERAQALAERMPELRPSPGAERVRIAQQKLAHERRRSAYPASRLRRIVPVLRAWRAGGYRRFGLGAQDVLRDLIQPV